MFSMTIPWTSSSFSIHELSSRFRKKKHCHCSSAFIYKSILILLPTNVKYDNTLNNFEFEGSRAKVKVTVAIFRKTLSLLYHLHLWADFAVTSHKCLV